MLADALRLLLEREAALGLHHLQVGQALEAPVGEGFIGQRPEMLTKTNLTQGCRAVRRKYSDVLSWYTHVTRSSGRRCQ